MSTKIDKLTNTVDELKKQNAMLFEMMQAMASKMPSARTECIRPNSGIMLPVLPLTNSDEVDKINTLLMDSAFLDQMVRHLYHHLIVIII